MIGRVIISEKGRGYFTQGSIDDIQHYCYDLYLQEMFICTFGILYTHKIHHIFVHITHKHTFHMALSDKNPGPHSAKPVQNSMDQLMEILKILVRRVQKYRVQACGSFHDFFDRFLLLTKQLLNQRFLVAKLKSSLRKFYDHHQDLN